jgi:hypothetical protein
MNVCLLALWGDSLSFTLANALAFNGHRVQVRVADPERHARAVWGTPQRIAAIPGISVVCDRDAVLPASLDHLVVQGHPLLLGHRALVRALADRAGSITLISSGDRSRTMGKALRLQGQELGLFGRRMAKVRRIAYKDGHFPFDLFAMLGSRRVVGFDPHAKFLQDRTLFDAMHARDWEVDQARPIRVNFLGSRDPLARGRILDSVEPFFSRPASPASPGQRMLWHAYTDANPAALSQQEFLRVLTDSDFTLSPPGYSLVTHRPVEALLRGSIPILHRSELDLYDMNLKDGVNCVAVEEGQWAQAMARVLAMSPVSIVAMRHAVRGDLLDRVSYPTLSREICVRLGVGDGR